MTETLIEDPGNLGYGIVKARFGRDIRDGEDVDDIPEYVALSGTVTFTASVSKVIDATATPDPIIIGRDPIVCKLDPQGYLCSTNELGEPMYRWVKLIATDDPDLNPTNWTWTVTYALVNSAGKAMRGFESHSISVPAGSTQDLANAITPDGTQSVGIPQANALAAAAALSAAESEARAIAAEQSAAAAEAALVDSTGFVQGVVTTDLADPESDLSQGVTANVQAGVTTAATTAGAPRDAIDARAKATATALGLRADGNVSDTRYRAYGTSYTAGAGAATDAEKYVTRVKVAVGATDFANGGMSGSISCGLPYGYMVQAPWTPGWQGGLVTIEGGINDIGTERQPKMAQQMYNLPENFATAMRWMRAKALIPFTDPSVDHSAFFEGATTVAGVPLANHYNNNGDGAPLTINALTDDDIVVLLFAWRSGSADAAEGHTYEVQVDGGPWRKRTTIGRGDQYDSSTTVNTLISERITGLHAGSVVKIKKTGSAGRMRLYPGYLQMGNPNPPRIVLVADVRVNTTGAAYPNGGNNVLMAQTWDRLRWLVRQPEFANDGTVTLAEPDTSFDPATDLDPDGLHPKGITGHLKIAMAVEQATKGLR